MNAGVMLSLLGRQNSATRKRNADSFERRLHSEDGDDEDGINEEMPNSARATGNGPDFHDSGGSEVHEDPPGWEMGIRRSSSAKSCRIEDLSLSDIILDPDGNITYYWLGMVTIAVVYNIASIVLRIAFSEMRETETEDSVFYLLDTLGDLIYLIDVFVHLRISFYEDGCLVLDPTRIVERYTQSKKFLVDIIAVVPLASVYSCLSVITSVFLIDLSIYIPGDIQIMVVRLPRLLKFSTMTRFFDFTDSRTRNPDLLRAFKLSLNLWMVIHWIGCAYYLLSEYEGLGTNDWVYPNGTDYSQFSRKYIRVMYWSLMTLTTIGERPPPETDLEFVFTGMTFLIGVFVFAAVVGNVGDVISNMNAARTEFQSRMDQINSYLQHRKVDEKLQVRVRRWADYTWNRTQSLDEPSLLLMLPDRLRTEIAINIHLDTLKKVKIFEECEEGLLRELVLKLRPQVYSPGDFICRTGEVGKEMFIVNHGKVEIMVPNSLTGKRSVVAVLNPGNYFGEISLLRIAGGQNRRTADVKAVGYSELLRLSRRDLITALTEYPNAKRILEEKAEERIQKTKAVRRSSSTGDVTTPESGSENGAMPTRKDRLLNIVKSDNFQKLLASRHTEVGELKKLMENMKQFDSQTTKDRIAFLQEQVNERDREIGLKDKEILLLRNKIARLANKDKAFRRVNPNSPVLARKHGKTPNGTDTIVQRDRTTSSATGGNDKCSKDTSSSAPGHHDPTNSVQHLCFDHPQSYQANRQVSRLQRRTASVSARLQSTSPVTNSLDLQECKCRQLHKSMSESDMFHGKPITSVDLPNSNALPTNQSKRGLTILRNRDNHFESTTRPSPQRHCFNNIPRHDKTTTSANVPTSSNAKLDTKPISVRTAQEYKMADTAKKPVPNGSVNNQSDLLSAVEQELVLELQEELDVAGLSDNSLNSSEHSTDSEDDDIELD